MPQEPLPLDVANKLSSNNLLISKSYKCAICPSMFNQKTHLTTHIDSVHLKKKNYFCSKCDYAATRVADLKRHYKNMHKTETQNQINDYDKSESGAFFLSEVV